MRVFFYGLFMDETLLASKGIRPAGTRSGFVADYTLHIGERATLRRKTGACAYGLLVEIGSDEVAELYSEASLVDYVPETVLVEFTDGRPVNATCYNLPVNKVSGVNEEYAAALLGLATRLGFPESYLQQILRSQS